MPSDASAANSTPVEQLSSLPIITKQNIKDDYTSFLSDELLVHDPSFLRCDDLDPKRVKTFALPSGTLVCVSFTSGSSGIPLMIIQSMNERLIMSRQMWQLRNKVASVKPSELFDFAHSNNNPNNGYPFPFDLVPDTSKRMAKELSFMMNSNYKWWHMNTYDIETYYNYITDQGLSFSKNHQLEVIENNGSYISRANKQRYGRLFSCSVIDHYGCTETWMIALDCKCGHLHVNEQHIYLELVDGNKVIDGCCKVGNVVLTSLDQYMMPFVRYKLDDLAYFAPGKCPCGSASRRIVLLPGKDRIIGTKLYGHRFFKDIIGYLISHYKVKDFYSISVTQLDALHFIINVKRNREDRNILERCFLSSSELIFRRNDYCYNFTYCDDVEDHGIFNIVPECDSGYLT